MRCHGRLDGSAAARQVFDTVDEVQDQATRWMWYYNYEGSDMALDGVAPNQRLAMGA
jgi:putative transposase